MSAFNLGKLPSGRKLSEGHDPNFMGSIVDSPATPWRVALAKRRGMHEIRERDLEAHGRYLADRASGRLYATVLHDPLLTPSGDPRDDVGAVELFALVDDGTRMVFLARPADGPATVADLEQAEQAEEARQAAAEKARLVAQQKQPCVPVLFGQSRGLGPVSLREVVADFEQVGGRVELGPDGRLQVTAPERLSGMDDFRATMESELREQVGRQAELIVHCRDLIEAALRSRNGAKTPLHETLPDGFVTVTGGVV